jgi:hypothetical protein
MTKPKTIIKIDDFILIYLLTAIGLTPGGSSTEHIYTQTVHRTTQSTQTIHRTTQKTIHRTTQKTIHRTTQKSIHRTTKKTIHRTTQKIPFISRIF